MADTLLNKVINEEIKVNSFIKWLLEANAKEQYFDEFHDCKCSQADFLTYFLNFVHEEIPCHNKCGDRDNLHKANPPRRIELDQNEEILSLSTRIDKTDINESASYQLLNKTFERNGAPVNNQRQSPSPNISHDTYTPKLYSMQPDNNIHNSYTSPVSPLYGNQNSFSTPKNKRQSIPQKTGEKISPLCLGDFIISRRSSGKKKPNRYLLQKEPVDESSKRINPTCLNHITMNGGLRKPENSFNNFQNTIEMSAECLTENRNFLAEERLKILSRKNSGNNLVVAASKKIVGVTNKVEIEPDVSSISNKSQLDYVVEVYVCILRNNLVLNITSEIYFLISLLVNKQFSFKECTTSSDDFYMGVGFLNEQGKTHLHSAIHKSRRKVLSSELFESIHNIVYFAAKCLESQINILMYYDKSMLKLLSENRRLRLFAGSFGEKLCKISNQKAERILEFVESDLQKNICFNLDTDNRENFPNDSSFHAFRKQRDLFYEILRIWENNRMLSGWNFATSLGGKIKSLFGLQNEPANFMHFSRLFKAQLLSTCGQSHKEEGLTENQMPFLSSLPNVDVDKLNRLRSRLVTKQSSNGINALPSFTGHQEFYKEFILIASNCAFNRHLCDTLITEIVELNDTKFSCTAWEESDSVVDPAVRKDYLACLKSLRVLAKFLGFVESLPYKSDCINYSNNLLTSYLTIRQQTTPSFNIKRLLTDSLQQNNIVLIVPWITEYLSMLDSVTLRLPYYISVYEILFDLYRNCETPVKASKTNYSYNIPLVRFCLGWLFELPHFPDSEYFNFCMKEGIKQTNKHGVHKSKAKASKSKALDALDIVDQNILYICCPYLEEIKKLLSSNALKSNITVKHITPVTAVQSSNEIAKKRIEQQLEEAFFNGQPISVTKTVEFVSERIASSCVKHICNTVVPSFRKTALEQLRSFLAAWKKEQVGILPSEEKFQKASLRIEVNQMTQVSLIDLRESCEKELYSIAREKIPASIDSLLAVDVLPQTKGVCVAIATKMCAERVRQWMSVHVTVSVFTKDFDGEVQRTLGMENKKTVKAKPMFALPSGGNEKNHNDNVTSAFHLLEKIRALTIDILENSTNINERTVLDILNEAFITLTERYDVNECITNSTCALLFDTALLLITHRPHIMLHKEVLEKFVQVWRCYCGKTEDLFKHLLCLRNLMTFSQSCNETGVWKQYANFIAFLIKEKLLTCDDFESQCTGFFKREWDKGSLENLTVFLQTFIDCYKRNGGSADKFVFLLEFLSDFCTDL